jgi:spore coat polysaccharide biosynthesis protein SpsF
MITAAIIQARMGSTRLPGKVLRKLGTRSVLAQTVRRVRAAGVADVLVVATTLLPADGAVAAEAAACGAAVYRGSEDDVLDRYYQAAREARADVVVRVTSDCPLYDGALLAAMHRRFTEPGGAVDYLSNALERTYPRGLDTEIFTFAALARAHREAADPAEREHVTPYLYRHPALFHLASHTGTPDRSNLRWTLDTEEDWAFLTAVVAALGDDCTTEEVVALLVRRPELVALNAHVEQKKV